VRADATDACTAPDLYVDGGYTRRQMDAQHKVFLADNCDWSSSSSESESESESEAGEAAAASAEAHQQQQRDQLFRAPDGGHKELDASSDDDVELLQGYK
jgi:hypothetical protein